MTTSKYTITVTAEQLSFIRDATELLSRIASGQVYETLRYAPIDPARYWEARGALLRALEPFEDKMFQKSIIDNGCWDIYQVARHRLAWDRKPEGDPFSVAFDEPFQTSQYPLPIIQDVED